MRTSRKWLPVASAVLLCSTGCSDEPVAPKPPPTYVDLVADANRDGVVDPDDEADQEREDAWDATVGASFIANLDDDDADGRRDCEDEIVNGDADVKDLATFVVRAWPDAPKGVKGRLTLDQDAAESVRVFKRGPDFTWALTLGSLGPCTTAQDCSYTIEHELTAEEVQEGVTFGIEARRFKGMPLPTLGATAADAKAKKNQWTGVVDLAFSIVDEDGKPVVTDDTDDDGVDHVKMRVAPWMLFGSMHPHTELWSAKASPAFVTGNTKFATAAEATYTPYAGSASQKGGWGDVWTEDFFQTGWTGFPGPDGAVHGMEIANARPFGRSNSLDDIPIKWILGNPAKGRAPGFLGPDRGGAAFYDPALEGKGHTQDSHGNHDLIPPHEGFPMGRIITGNKTHPSTIDFYSQNIQGPALILDTTWLAVEHVDEFFHWVPAKTPRGWKLLVASPSLMLKMLEDLEAAGQGEAVLHKGKGGSYQKTVAATLADSDLAEWSQTAEVKIQGHIDLMKAETGLTDDEIIPIPTWFEELDSNSKVAWNPGMVNMRLIGDRANVPKPFGPTIDGKDPFEEDLRVRLGSAMHALGSDGEGLDVLFTDDWYYHSALGEVHCGTNESAPVTAALGLWWESGK